MACATDEAMFKQNKQLFEQDIARLAEPLDEGLFDTQGGLSLVDAAIAPLFMRIRYLAEFNQLGEVKLPQQVESWAQRLLQRPAVKASVVVDFADRYKAFLMEKDSWLCRP
jgi:glutathione S-transferase